MFYSKKTGGFYDLKIHGDAIPSDAVEITDEYHFSLIESQSNGGIIAANELGFPVAIYPPESTVPELIERTKGEMRALRTDILNAVTGIGFRANVVGNSVLAQEAAQVSQQLLDITDDPALHAAQTYDDMRAAGMAAYRRIADSVSPGLRSAFKELER